MCHETLLHFCMPATDKILRTVAVYCFLVIGLRLAGKRELGQFTAFDLVVLITISNTVQNAIIGPENSLSGGLLGGAVLLLINNLVSRLTYHVRFADRLLVGRESVVYADGAIDMRAAARERITPEEIMSAARRQGVRDLHEVERIVLETNGNLSVILKQDMSLHRIMQELNEIKRLVSE